MSNSPLSIRASGILLHPTSLPGPCGIGDLGPAADRFVEFLSQAGQTWWQMLPIHPVGGGDSPYDSPSAFAGSHLLISPERLAHDGLLSPDALAMLPRPPFLEHVDFTLAHHAKAELLRQAFETFRSGNHGLADQYQHFLDNEGAWAWDWALFVALKGHFGQRPWTEWPAHLVHREPEAMGHAHERHKEDIEFELFVQFIFHHQWEQLKRHCEARGIRLMGDIPMFVAHDSVDVWANQGMFFLDEDGHRTVQAGVPPDYFSEDGQLWGNPLYRWDVMKRDGYGWWIDRLQRELHRFDAVRIDHFIGLSRYWEVAMGAENAKNGRYLSVPGKDFLEKAQRALGELPVVAEDLGIVTRDVEELRDQFGLPGMKILQFAFNPGAEVYLPHRHGECSVAYTGTHDNNTTRGWYEELLSRASSPEEAWQGAAKELARVHAYTGVRRAGDITWSLIRFLMSSPANLAIVPLQDVLDQGGDSRMNVPGQPTGNWVYRFPPDALLEELAERLRELAEVTERAPRWR